MAVDLDTLEFHPAETHGPTPHLLRLTDRGDVFEELRVVEAVGTRSEDEVDEVARWL